MSEEVRPILPLDERDEALWMLQRMFPEDGIPNIGLAVYLAGRIDPEILSQAALSVLERHAALRSLVRVQDGRACRIVRDLAEVSARVDIRMSTQASLDADMRDVARRPFDLEQDDLTRFTLFELPDTSQVLLVVIHHLAIDARSVTQFLDDLAAAYQSLASTGILPPAAQPTAPLRRPPEPTEESLKYWGERVANLHPGSMLLDAADYASATASFAGGRYEQTMSASVPDAVRRLRRHTHASDNVVLLAACLALLLRHGAGPDLVVGLPVSLHTDELADTVGNYFSTVPVAVRATPLTTFAKLVDDTLTAFIEAFEHRDLSYEGMIRRFGRGDQDWQTPIFRHMFNFLPTGPKDPARHDWAKETRQIDSGYSRYDLEFVVGRSAESYSMQIAYRSDLHDESFARRLADRYEVLLAAAANDPERAVGRLPMITHHDRVVGLANQTSVTWPGPRTTAGMVSAQIARRPTDVAIASSAGHLTYRQLGHLARRIRARLTAGGVGIGIGDIVAVASGRGPATAAAILAVWRAGAAYLPLDPAQPTERLRYQLRDANASALVADSETIERLADPAMVPVPADEILSAESAGEEADHADANVAQPREPDQDSIAYVIYTSGSTGKPKAVQITHGNLANAVRHFSDMLNFQAGQKMLWLTTLAFDISALEFLVPLSRGGTVVVAEAQAQTRPERLIEIINEFGVDAVQATPTSWRMIVGLGGLDLTGRWLLCGGEPLSGGLARKLLATGGRLVNVYGPTETTIWSTAEPIRQAPEESPAVGRPIANTTIAVVDEFGADCPVDVLGEVVIGGAGVAAGYLGHADLTAERFIVRGETGRAYRTGDLGRWRNDGRLALHGRMDRQVKVHGGRIELDEVESVIKSHPAVEGAAVVLLHPGQLTEALAAFVVPSRQVTTEELWNHAARHLPSYAVPSTMTLVVALPVNSSGKTDYVRLAAFVADGMQPPEAPASRPAVADDLNDEITTWLVGQWRDLLDNPSIQADSNLFLAGGQSLLAISITDEVRRRYDVDLPALAIFRNPTPRGLAAEVKACQVGTAATTPGEGHR
jgi:amino acid adenylation domain-containing protein